MLDKQQLKEYLNFAHSTAEDAGTIALRYFRIPIIVDNKIDTLGFDPVTKADKEIEAFIREKISHTYPAHSIIGEEEGTSEGVVNLKWVIDPIDGTRAFISGAPMWGILLGLMDGDNCEIGLMHQPYLQETFTGSSIGAFMNKGKTTQPISTRNTTELNEAILYCTHPSMFTSKKAFDSFSRVADECKLMRYGGDCYSYCLLAYGFVDLVIESGLKPYDIIPLIPIIESAGGVVTDWQGNSASLGGDIIASANTALHEQVLKLLG